ncbi:hypothetical protein V6Z11_A05G088600 [Gossypium hirsutum]
MYTGIVESRNNMQSGVVQIKSHAGFVYRKSGPQGLQVLKTEIPWEDVNSQLSTKTFKLSEQKKLWKIALIYFQRSDPPEVFLGFDEKECSKINGESPTKCYT